MRPPPRTHRAALAAAGLLLLLSAARARADAVAQSCGDCCKMQCVEAEIVKAKFQREGYRALSQRKNMTLDDYQTQQRSLGAVGESVRVSLLGGLETCNYYIPADQSYAESREFIMAGFKVTRDDHGNVLPSDYTLNTDLSSCKANSKALELAPKVAPCSGIGDAQVAHEMQHVADCDKRDPAKRQLTPAQTAAGEIAGYDVEIAQLEKLRKEIAGVCNKTSCKTQQSNWDVAAQQMGSDILKLLGKSPKKPPSKSPLARKGGGH